MRFEETCISNMLLDAPSGAFFCLTEIMLLNSNIANI